MISSLLSALKARLLRKSKRLPVHRRTVAQHKSRVPSLNVVNVTTTDELVERGYLAPMTVYAAKAADMTGAKVVASESARAAAVARVGRMFGLDTG